MPTKKPILKKSAAPKAKSPAKAKRKILHVFVNTEPNTVVKIHQWKIKPLPKGSKETPDFPRVEIQNDDLCYSLILDPLEPKVKTWEIDENGQLSKHPVATVGLPYLLSE